MSREAEAEALAMDYSTGALNVRADLSFPLDGRPEALAMSTQEGPRVHAGTALANPPAATVAAAGVATSKNNLPVLDLLHWSETPSHKPNRARISATNDSSAFMNASDESPFIQPPIRSEVRTSQMSREAEAEALAMDYSAGALNVGADLSFPLDGRPEALAMGTQEGQHVHAGTALARPPAATVAAAGVATSKDNLPVPDLLHWSETPSHKPNRARIFATNDSSAFMNASDESPFIQPPIRSEARTSQMSREAEAEALAMDYSAGALNVGADLSFPLDGRLEVLAMGTQEAPHVHAGTALARPPAATVAAAGVATSKNNLPVLDFLHWSETPSHKPNRARMSATNDSSAFMNASDESPFIQPPIRSEARTSQPAGGVSTITFGANLTLEESEQLQKRRPGSDSKRREMIGSRIFGQDLNSEPAPADHSANKTLPAGLVNPIRSGSRSSAITEDSALSPKRSSTLSEMAKQRELSGTFFGAGRDAPTNRRPNSSAKSKELEGSNIFGRSSQDQLNTTPKSVANDHNKYQENNAPPRTSVKVSNPAGGRSQIIFGNDGGQQNGVQCKMQAHNQKATELSGHEIFKDKTSVATINNNGNNNNERLVSAAKRREMIGNDIFSDSSPINEDRPRRARQPPGGDSNLKLC